VTERICEEMFSETGEGEDGGGREGRPPASGDGGKQTVGEEEGLVLEEFTEELKDGRVPRGQIICR